MNPVDADDVELTAGGRCEVVCVELEADVLHCDLQSTMSTNNQSIIDICKSLFTNNMVDDKKQREITEKLN